jgi:predicted DNA-binding transcriptional regulator AlpA
MPKAAQVEPAKKAARLKAAATKQTSRPAPATPWSAPVAEAMTPAQARPAAAPRGPPCLLTKHEVCARVKVTFPTIWKWMRAGTFPRSRELGAGKSSKVVWLEAEVEAWMAALPVRPLKGDEEAA